jgi:hypothetical protein
MATKERLAAMAASRCAVCSGAMVIKLVAADPGDVAMELRPSFTPTRIQRMHAPSAFRRRCTKAN